MEPIFRHTFLLDDIYLDSFGRLKPSSILYFIQEAAGHHCKLLQVDWDTLAKQSLFWAVTRHRVQITRLPTRGETITVETWPMPTTRVAYPRCVIAYDTEGKELFRSVSLWVLMDLESRALVLPGKSGVDVGGTLIGNELSVPHSLAPKELKNTATRTVTYTCLDRNGHMNNTHYPDMLCDFTENILTKRVTGMTLSFLHEGAYGHTLKVLRREGEEGRTFFRTLNESGETCLEAVLTFEPIAKED